MGPFTMFTSLVLVCGLLIADVYGLDAAVVNRTVAVNCSDAASILSWEQKCFDRYRVPITIPVQISSLPPDQMASALTQIDTSSANVCSPENREHYIEANICIYNIMMKCAGDIPLIQALYPSPQRLRLQIELGCYFEGQGMDQSCTRSILGRVQNCMKSLKEDNTTNEDSEDEGMCATFDLLLRCGRKYLGSCGDSAVALFEQNLNEPDSCKNYTDSGEMAEGCGSTVAAKIRYLTCQINAGISPQLPDMDSSTDFSEYILKSVILENTQQMCRNLSVYSDLINCTLSVQRECSSDSLKTTAPDTQSVLKELGKLCQNVDQFDGQCVVNTTKSACKERKRRSLSNYIILKHICRDTSDHNKCLVDSVKSCGDVTSSQYVDILNAQLPQMCLKENTKSPSVTTDPTGKAANKPALSVCLLVLSVIILH